MLHRRAWPTNCCGVQHDCKARLTTDVRTISTDGGRSLMDTAFLIWPSPFRFMLACLDRRTVRLTLSGTFWAGRVWDFAEGLVSCTRSSFGNPNQRSQTTAVGAKRPFVGMSAHGGKADFSVAGPDF